MKAKTNARQKREAEQRRRKDAVRPPRAAKPTPAAVPERRPAPVKRVPEKTPEEETREFLDYLENYKGPVMKDTARSLPPKQSSASGTIYRLNLEEGMPLVEEALDRMNMGLQEMRHSREKTVKLIHGYGSTGRGGSICAAVRRELAQMKRKKYIRDYIPGEDFGPLDAASRKWAEQIREIPRDPDYGRMNHGITIVVL